MALQRRGLSMEVIRKEVGSSAGTLHHDTHTVFEGYERFAARSAQEHIAGALPRLAVREIDIERECIGIELPQNPQGNQHLVSQASQKAAHSSIDPDLAALIAMWPALPEPIKAGILAMVRAARG